MSSKIDNENKSIISRIEKVFSKLIKRTPKIFPDESIIKSFSCGSQSDKDEYYNIILPNPNTTNPNSHPTPNMYPPKQIDFDIYLKCFIHEIKTPLMNITLGLELLGDGLSEEQKQVVKDVKKSVIFVEDILSKFQVIHDGNIVLNPFTPFSIVTMMKTTETILYPYLKKSKIQYSFVSDLQIYEWNYGDVHNLQHILLNIIKNAVKYRNESITNTLVVKASLVEDTESTQTIQMIVQDNNDHILPHIKERLFGVFNSTSGSGLGLFICKNILELHNGTISHNFIEPVGNEFVITIRLVKCLDPALQVKSNEASFNVHVQESKEPNTTKTIGILIIDDSELSCKMFKQVFHQVSTTNIYVYTANNVIDGLKAVIESTKNVQIVFIDKNLPNINGLVFTKILNMLDYNGLIFGVTGETDNNDFMESGANYVFIKPMNRMKITQVDAFVNTYGAEVQKDKKIEQVNNRLEWVPKE